MALQNHSAALRMSMPEIIRQYVRTFDLQNRIAALRSVSGYENGRAGFPCAPGLRDAQPGKPFADQSIRPL